MTMTKNQYLYQVPDTTKMMTQGATNLKKTRKAAPLMKTAKPVISR